MALRHEHHLSERRAVDAMEEPGHITVTWEDVKKGMRLVNR